MTKEDLSQNFNLSILLDQFSLLENHPSYFIRTKLYNNQGKIGLKRTKNQLDEIISEYQLIDTEVVEFHKNKIKEFYANIVDSINLILKFEEYDLELDELKKYSLYIQDVVQRLGDFVLILTKTKQDDINDLALIHKENRQEMLKHRYEDNIDQLLKSFTWKEYETTILDSEDDAEFSELTKLLSSFNSSKLIGSQIENQENLELLARFSTVLKDRLADNFEEAFVFIPLLHTLCKIFDGNKQINHPDQEKSIPITYFRKTVDHLINMSRIEWLGNFYRSFMEDTMSGNVVDHHQQFAVELYNTTHDPRENFLWTMSYYSRLQKDDEMVKLSFKVANLTSMLLTILDKLENVGETSLIKSVINLKEISYEDAISDVSEIYKGRKNWGKYMKQALKSKLSDLKELILQIIEFEEIFEEILFLMQLEISRDEEMYPVTADRLRYVVNNY